MKEEEKALAAKVHGFFKAFAPTKVKEIRLKEDIFLPDNDVDNFTRVVMCYKTNAPLYPVFCVEGGTLDSNDVFWFVPSTGPRANVKIDKKYLKEVVRMSIEDTPARDVWTSYPKIGLNVVKFAKSVRVCVKCRYPVVVSKVNEKTGVCEYTCFKDTCPAFGKTRNRQQYDWQEFATTAEFRKVGL